MNLRTLQAVQVAANLKILDSPGIVMENPIVQNNTLLCLKNLVRSDRLTDPIQAAQAILLRATKEQVCSYFTIIYNSYICIIVGFHFTDDGFI